MFSFLTKTTNNKGSISLEDLHEYWREPHEDGHQPLELYLNGIEKSEFLVDILRNRLHLPSESTILEIGCSSGRNLIHLFKNDYKFLAGLEINKDALNLFSKKDPLLYKNINLFNFALEEYLEEHEGERYDVVFSMATFENIHYDSDWAFERVAAMTRKYLVTIEDEKSQGAHHFPRNYKLAFRKSKLKQVESINCKKIPLLGKNYVARIFKAPKS